VSEKGTVAKLHPTSPDHYRLQRGAPGVSESRSLRRIFASTNHRDIGTKYLLFAIVAALIGVCLSGLTHAELAQPGLGLFADPRKFDAFVTGHELIIVCFVIMPAIIGGFGNWFTPLMIGAPDMAFPRLNNFSFGLLVSSFLTLFLSLFVEGNGGQTLGSGWTAHAWLSTYGPPRSAMGLAVFALLLAGISSILSAINFITTIFDMREAGLTLRKMPLFVWSILVAAVLLLLTIPVLAAAITMLFAEPHFGTRFFHSADAHDPIRQLLWFFGHPEVYILAIPGFGIISQVVSTFSKRPVFGRLGLVYAMVSFALIGFLVWAHHMYTVGVIVDTRAHLAFAAMAVSLPVGINIFSWIATMWGGALSLRAPMLWALGAIFLLTVGGVSGMALAGSGMGQNDTYYVVAHFQYLLLLAAVFTIFAGWYYWFPKITGYMYNETLSKQHFWITLLGVSAAYFPRVFMTLGGKPGPDIANAFERWNQLSSTGAAIAGFGILMFLATMAEAFMRKRVAGDNVWGATTLEWTACRGTGR
jgi:cytochrome c oxidase subunit 1